MTDIIKEASKPLTEPLVNDKPDMLDFIIGGIAKKPLEDLIAKTPIGDGNLISAAVKIGGAYALSKVKTKNKIVNKGLNGLCIASTVDGCEDAAVTAKRWIQNRNRGNMNTATAAAETGAW